MSGPDNRQITIQLDKFLNYSFQDVTVIPVNLRNVVFGSFSEVHQTFILAVTKRGLSGIFLPFLNRLSQIISMASDGWNRPELAIPGLDTNGRLCGIFTVRISQYLLPRTARTSQSA
jgi:hypothetical protein